jgi:hypothetical protein
MGGQEHGGAGEKGQRERQEVVGVPQQEAASTLAAPLTTQTSGLRQPALTHSLVDEHASNYYNDLSKNQLRRTP